MTASFIYVFNDNDRDTLLAMNYEMIQCDRKNRVYVFLNQERQDFARADLKYALSNTLTL